MALLDKLSESQYARVNEAFETGSIRRVWEALQESASTSDFPLLLANVLNKSLQRAYRVVPDQWRQIVTIDPNIPDFKPKQITRLSEADDLEEILGEPGEYKDSKLVEAKESYTLSIFGRTFSITWKTIINDDMSALTKQPDKFGRSAARLLNNLVFGTLETNPVMGDGNELFSTAHGNLGTGRLSEANICKAVSAMKNQTDDNGKRIYVEPKFIIVPTVSVVMEWQLRKLLNTVNEPGSGNNDINTLRELNLVPIYCPWLTNAYAWYLISDPAVIDTIEVGFLRGVGESPQLFLKDPGWTTIGGAAVSPFQMDDSPIQYKVRHIAQSKPIDWRGMYKSTGLSD